VKPKLSIIIPSYKDPLLHKTIDSILENFTGSYEIIPVIDGYSLKKPLRKDKRIRPLILKRNRGMRNAINRGIKASNGKFIMRTDEHCMFAEGFDREILSVIEDNWIVTARRYFLDPKKWEKMLDKRSVDYEKLIIFEGRFKKFAGVRWRKRELRRRHISIDETMAMQGSCWVMKRSWWNKVIKELQSEGYGTHYQDSVEMLFKTWQAGGKLMVNKNTWFAHKHRKFSRTHNYPHAKAQKSFDYALKIWQEFYFKNVRPKWRLR
jgi:glycosyltransferase involved in cell wall biosynthesis